MKVVWEHGEATVRQIHEALPDHRKPAYTSVMTILGVLEGKGHVEKTVGESGYVYRPTRPKDEVLASMVADFVGRAFNGSAQALIQHLVQTELVSPEDLDDIARLSRSSSLS